VDLERREIEMRATESRNGVLLCKRQIGEELVRDLSDRSVRRPAMMMAARLEVYRGWSSRFGLYSTFAL